MKKTLIGLGIIAVCAVGYVIYTFSTFTLFNADFKVIEEVKVPNETDKLKIYYIPSNASSQSYIQIRKIKNGVEEVLQSYERFNFLNEYEIIGQDTIKLVISDTSKVKSKKEVKLKLP